MKQYLIFAILCISSITTQGAQQEEAVTTSTTSEKTQPTIKEIIIRIIEIILETNNKDLKKNKNELRALINLSKNVKDKPYHIKTTNGFILNKIQSPKTVILDCAAAALFTIISNDDTEQNSFDIKLKVLKLLLKESAGTLFNCSLDRPISSLYIITLTGNAEFDVTKKSNRELLRILLPFRTEYEQDIPSINNLINKFHKICDTNNEPITDDKACIMAEKFRILN